MAGPPAPSDASTITAAGVGTRVDDLALLRIEIAAGPDAGAAHEVSADRIVIGTHESSTIRLTDRTVSRFHCEIARRRDALVLRDLGSHNGTFIEGVSIREAVCPEFAVITLGETRVVVRATGRTVAVENSLRETFGKLSGRSAPMRRLLRQLERVAQTDATILLLGETGTGKEYAAESLHAESLRAGEPLIIVDCGAIPADLLESELFGHERGAFTGAVREREGAFQAASGGTIFLDEIGELPPDLQPKLLRALSRRAVKRVGSEAYVDVNVRIIAATNRDLREEVNANRFRGDLYYRLAVVEIRMPPLRDRLDDLPLLVEAMLDDCKASPAETSRLLSTSFLELLRRHAWPGNLREFRNVIDRALALGVYEPEHASDPPLAPAADAAPPIDLARPFKEARDEWTATFERTYLAALMERHHGNIRAAARAADIDRVHLYRLLARYGLRPQDSRGVTIA